MNVFAKMLVKPKEDITSVKVREKLGKRTGILGILLNTVLATAKIVCGAIFGIVSILADGFNNLTDCGSNVVSYIGFKMSGKPADKEHPFGHERAESLSALIVSILIIVVAFELLMQSIDKITNPTPSLFSYVLIIVLAISIAVKILMFLINNGLGKAIDSKSLIATGKDSLSDVIATSSVLIALLISEFTGVNLDAYAGIIVSIFIFITGIQLVIETISHLLGKAPSKEIIKEIEDRIMAYPEAHGIHDLAVHNYGPNKMYATVHVEVDSSMPIMSAHDLADNIEKDFIENTSIILTVHIDPLVLNDPVINKYREETEQAIFDINPVLKIHDFRIVGAVTHTNLVFDVAVPFDVKDTDAELEQKIKSALEKPEIGVVVTIERQNLD